MTLSPRRAPRLLAFALALVSGAPSFAAGEEGERPPRHRDRPRERADWNAELRRDASGALSSENRLRALRAACGVPADPALARPVGDGFSRSDAGPSVRALGEGLAWRELGPRGASSGTAWGSVAGRITAVALHPSNADVVLVGAATGGIWKSTDGGRTFRPVSDTAPSLATSAIVFSPSSPDVLYAATGEADSAYLERSPASSLGTYLGAGLLRSVDGGETWSRVDVDLPADAVLSRVLVHPADPRRVLVAIYRRHDVAQGRTVPGGIYLSTDGGVHFARTFEHAASDLAQDPSSPDVVFAAFGVDGGCTTCSSPGGVWRSADFGLTFSPALTHASPGAPFAVQPGQVKLTVSRTSPAVLYASVLDGDDAHVAAGIFRSADGGLTWEKRTAPAQACPKSADNQCSYDHALLVHPARPDRLWLGTVNLYVSDDGAATWRTLVEVYARGSQLHPDQHAFAVPSTEPSTLWVGNDGGLYRSTDGGASFESRNDTLGLVQFNGVALHPAIPAFLMGGTQDNGNLRTLDGVSWSDRTGSDGGFVLVRQDDPAQVLAANYYAYLNYSSTTGGGFREVTSPQLMTSDGEPAEPMAFYPPAAAAPGAPGTVFLGAQRLWANPSFGANPNLWAPRSAEKALAAGVVTALDVVGDGSGPAWVGGSRGDVLFSEDGGATFARRTDGLPAAIVTAVRSVSADGRTAYVAFGGYLGAPSRHVFVTTDGGLAWRNVSGEIPDVPVTALVTAPGDPCELFAATDAGVFRSTNGGASWVSFDAGLPNTTVTALAFRPGTRDLVAATYGRGDFTISVPLPGADAPPRAAFATRPGRPAPGQSVSFADLSTGEPSSWLWSFGDGATSTERSPRHVFATAGTRTVTLTATNAGGSSTATKSVEVAAGAPSPVALQVPVVLDVFGVAPTHYTSDLVVLNRSGAPTRLSLRYVAAPGTPGGGGPRVGETLEAGQELRVADVLGYLRGNGYDLPPSGPVMAGTLRVTFEDVEDPALAWAGSRTSTPNPNAAVGGSFGLFLPALPASAAPGAEAVVVGLREDATSRTNLALVDVPPSDADAGDPARLSVQLFDGDTGRAAGAPVEVALAPGEWRQLDRVLARAGVPQGWARITRTSGTNRFLAYGVRNDGSGSGPGTSDGSPLPAGATEGLVPVVLRATAGATTFTSQLVLANPSPSPVTATLSYTPSPLLGGGRGGGGTLALAPGQQVEVPDVMTWLHDAFGIAVPAPPASVGGTLLVRGAAALARTSNPNPDAAVGGTFGLAYPALDDSARARTECWVLGLAQDGETRSNLAVADARVGDARSVAYVVDVFADASPAAAPVLTKRVLLAGGEWTQLSGILLEAGLSRGHARVRVESGSSDFAAYGVLNDGASPGSRTSDGSYVPMTGLR
ncbi:MAG: PKD domain-containing protein [Thermoanaerobaculia bacterium]